MLPSLLSAARGSRFIMLTSGTTTDTCPQWHTCLTSQALLAVANGFCITVLSDMKIDEKMRRRKGKVKKK